MDCDEMEALRELVEFARAHRHVYNTSPKEYTALVEAIETAERYLDGDQNEEHHADHAELGERLDGCEECEESDEEEINT